MYVYTDVKTYLPIVEKCVSFILPSENEIFDWFIRIIVLWYVIEKILASLKGIAVGCFEICQV